MAINKNRIITITREDSDDGKNKSWKNNISFLMGIYAGNKPIIRSTKDVDVDNNIELLMSEKFPKIKNELNFGKSSVLQTLFGNESSGLSKITTLLSATSNGTSDANIKQLAPWVADMPLWENKDVKPISFSYTFKFNLGQYGLWDAYKEVFLPIVNLSVPTFLQQIGASYVTGPFPTGFDLVVNFIKSIFEPENYGKHIDTAKGVGNNLKKIWGNTVTDIKTATSSIDLSDASTIAGGVVGIVSTLAEGISDGLENLAAILEYIILNSFKSYIFTVKFGNFMTFNHMTITGSEFEFSNEVDQNGYPISGSITLSFKGMVPPAFSTDNDVLNNDRLAVIFGSNT